MTPLDAAAFQHKDWASHPSEQIAEGVERQMIWGERLMVCRLSLAPRIVTPVHSHKHEQITIVGAVACAPLVAGLERSASAGDVFFPSGMSTTRRCRRARGPGGYHRPPREDFLADVVVR